MIRYQRLELELVVLLYVFNLPVLLLLLATWYGYTLLLEKRDWLRGTIHWRTCYSFWPQRCLS